MPFANAYLTLQAGPALIHPDPDPSLGIIITIPCYKEPDLLSSLESLYECTRPACSAEIIVLINHPEEAPEEDKKLNDITFAQAAAWSSTHGDEKLKFHILFCPNLPQKDAGVGMARKIAMDEAARRFNRIEKPEGIIAGFDADTRCKKNYLTALEAHFLLHPQSPGASVYFEHPISPEKTLSAEGIARYELHLRYVMQGLRYAKVPHAFHTIGSGFAVRALPYVREGGMNRRKAGEDFYFLHKIIPLGNFTELNDTTVYPSPRPSDRVPFGTGAGITKWMEGKKESLYTYQPDVFSDLKSFLTLIPACYHAPQEVTTILKTGAPESMMHFLEENQFVTEMARINRYSASPESFLKGFYAWFNGFKVVKFLNYTHQQGYFSRCDVYQAATRLPSMQQAVPFGTDLFTLLEIYRKKDQGVQLSKIFQEETIPQK